MNLYTAINPLTDESRIEARARAAAIVAKENGDQPTRDQFQNITISKYPVWVSRLILALAAFVLVAAFVPSAIRLYAIGSQTFEQAIQDEASAMAAGLAIVIMSETAQILFSLAAAVLNTTSSNTSRRLLYASMGAATVLALVGNAQVSLPGHWTNPFAYLEALLPPLLVLSTAYVLKEQMLMSIETRHANERAFQEALVNWKQANANPERHPRYMSALANALRDALKDTNSRGTGSTNRKELMVNLDTAHWRALVWRELKADEWYGDSEATLPEPPPLPSRNNSHQEPEPKEAEPPAGVKRPFGSTVAGLEKVAPASMPMIGHANGNGNGAINGGSQK